MSSIAHQQTRLMLSSFQAHSDGPFQTESRIRRYCIDVVTQVSAVRAALRRAEEEILADHVAHCVEHAIASGDRSEQRRKVSELIDVLSRSDR